MPDPPDNSIDNQPITCPECNHNKFSRIKPEKCLGWVFLSIFAFAVDLFTPGMARSSGLDMLNQRKGGWTCDNCGWEVRVTS
jgi:RNase P subunit RPR2